MIALITDFGSNDYYPGVMRGRIKKENRSAEIIDLCHDTAPFSVLNAQYILNASYRYFPWETLFVVVIDPGVGTERDILIAVDNTYRFIFPDNGIISAVYHNAMSCYRLDSEQFGEASSTFHGRDIFAPAAASIDSGLDPQKFGPLTDDFFHPEYPEYSINGGIRECLVQHIDTFGNIVTTLPSDTFSEDAAQLYEVRAGKNTFTAGIYQTFSDIDEKGAGLIKGSSGFIEIAAKMAPLARRYGLIIGDYLTIKEHA